MDPATLSLLALAGVDARESGPAERRVAAVHATLSAGDVNTEYRRGGDGDVVIVVVGDALREPLFSALAAHCRVIMPVATTPLNGEPVVFSPWLHDFLEGLGTPGVLLVVAEPSCREAIEFVQAHTSQIERLLLLSGDATLRAGPECPTCVLAESSASLVEDAVRFLLSPLPHTLS